MASTLSDAYKDQDPSATQIVATPGFYTDWITMQMTCTLAVAAERNNHLMSRKAIWVSEGYAH